MLIGAFVETKQGRIGLAGIDMSWDVAPDPPDPDSMMERWSYTGGGEVRLHFADGTTKTVRLRDIKTLTSVQELADPDPRSRNTDHIQIYYGLEEFL